MLTLAQMAGKWIVDALGKFCTNCCPPAEEWYVACYKGSFQSLGCSGWYTAWMVVVSGLTTWDTCVDYAIYHQLYGPDTLAGCNAWLLKNRDGTYGGGGESGKPYNDTKYPCKSTHP